MVDSIEALDSQKSQPEPDPLTAPKAVGSRELKTRLGTYLRLVKKGVTLIITDRGRPVAELRPLSGRDDHLQSRLYELAAEGVIGSEVAERRELEPFEPIVASGSSASDTVLAQRADRF